MNQERTAVHISVLDIVRFFVELFAFFSLALWGFVAWPFPGNILVGVAAPVTAITLWALFRSPRAVIPIGVFGRAVVEIAVMAAAGLAWVGLGHPVVGVVFAAIAAVTGVIIGRKDLA